MQIEVIYQLHNFAINGFITFKSCVKIGMYFQNSILVQYNPQKITQIMSIILNI